MSNKKKIKVGIVGMGGIGRVHLPIYSKMKDVKLLAFSDVVRKKDIERKYRVEWYESYDSMLDNEDLDAVSLCTPPYLHFKIAKDCIGRGISVLIEKPVCKSLEEVKKLYELSNTHSSVILPGYSLFFDQGVQKLSSLVQREELGALVFAYFNMASPAPSASWYYQKAKSGGGVIVDKGAHLFPIISKLFGTPDKIDCEVEMIPESDIEQKAEIILKYEGFNTYIMLNWLQSKMSTRMEIHGTGGSFILDGYGTTRYISEEVYGFSLTHPHLALQLMKEFGGMIKGRFLGSKAEIYVNEIKTFINLVKGIESEQYLLIPTMEDAVKTWELVEKIYKEVGIDV